MSVRLSLLGTALVVALVTAGCGDPIADHIESQGVQPYSEDDDAERGKADGPDRVAEFEAAGDRLCDRMLGPIRNLSSPTDGMAAVQMLVAIERAFRDGADRFAMLGAPDEARTEVLTGAVDAVRASADDMAEVVAAARAGDLAGYHAAMDAMAWHLDEAERFLGEAGFARCAA